jgi:hypothetical protein
MSSLTPRQRLAVLAGLVDGNSERAVERMTTDMGIGVTQKTIGKFALRLGRAAWSLHNTMAHGKLASRPQSTRWASGRRIHSSV